CYSCGHITFANEKTKRAEVKGGMIHSKIMALKARGISKESCAHYRYGIGRLDGEVVHVAPYYDAKGALVAQKIRTKDKEFLGLGDLKAGTLFGQQVCRIGGKQIVVTEGEIDAMSMFEAMGRRWPAVSLKNGAGQGKGAAKAAKELVAQLDFLNSFERIILAFDQ
ncbi:MAG: hypothetical protein R6U40_03495, partial [Desulfobacterales bacterium]